MTLFLGALLLGGADARAMPASHTPLIERIQLGSSGRTNLLLRSVGAQQSPPKKQAPSTEGSKAQKSQQPQPQEKPPAQEPSGQAASEKKKEEEKTPEFWDLVRKWVYEHWGAVGLGFLALLVVAGTIWWNWEKFKELPGVKQVFKRIRRVPIPKADPSKYSVGVAYFDHDPDDEHQRIVVAALASYEGIQVLTFERVISTRGADATAAEQAGHAKAREYLRESEAQALIWGEVLTKGQESVPRLFWTVAQEGAPVKGAERYLPSREMELPQVFWSDLNDVLLLLAATQAAEFEAKRGQYIADRLKPFIKQTRNLVNRSRGSAEMNVEQRASLLVLFADSLSTFGDQAGDSKALEEAITAYREALKEYTREKVPLDWAGTQNNLGNALRSLGERESGTARLEEAVAAFREALQEYTREKVPLAWAMTQNNLGATLKNLGQRESGTERLEEAVTAYREALKEYTQEKVPLDWATTQNNLGNTLGSLGERESGTERLEEAVAAYREALKERTREKVPLNWAMTQNNLGATLRSLGERESGTERLEEAVAAHREALKERTQEKVPLKWAMTTANLGLVLEVLAIRQSDPPSYCASLVELLRAHAVFKEAGAEYYEKKAAGSIASAIERMKATFGEEAFESCRAKHAALFGLLR